MIYDSGRKPNLFGWLNIMYICYNVWFVTKLFFKTPIFVVWVAFCLTYLFFKPNMYILFVIHDHDSF